MKNRNNRLSVMKLGLICLSTLLLNGCASWFVPGMGELKRLCELDGGDKIYKVVHTDGYYDVDNRCGSVCLEELIKSGFEYIEYHETKKQSYFYSAIKEPGIWRIYKSQREDPLCKPHLQKEFEDFEDQRLKAFFSSNCLAAKKLDKPQSQYWYKNSIDVRFLDNNQEVEFIKEYQSIEDVDTKEVIASTNHYSLVPYKKSALSYSASFDCAAAGVNIKFARFPESILLPNR